MVNWILSDLLSPFFFLLCTNDYQSSQGKTYLFKYADYTVLLSLFSHLDQEYGLGWGGVGGLT